MLHVCIKDEKIHISLCNETWVLNISATDVVTVPGMQSTPRTMEEPVPMEENSVGDTPPSQSHLQDLLLHDSDTPASYEQKQAILITCKRCNQIWQKYNIWNVPISLVTEVWCQCFLNGNHLTNKDWRVTKLQAEMWLMWLKVLKEKLSELHFMQMILILILRVKSCLMCCCDLFIPLELECWWTLFRQMNRKKQNQCQKVDKEQGRKDTVLGHSDYPVEQTKSVHQSLNTNRFKDKDYFRNALYLSLSQSVCPLKFRGFLNVLSISR